MEDWRHDQAKALPMRVARLEEPVPEWEGRFDLVFSFNTLEHVDKPDRVLENMLAMLRPGGRAVIAFKPLFASAWGLHAYRTLTMPYSQFLFSETFIDDKLRELGIRDLGARRSELQPLNRWSAAEFRSLWDAADAQIEHSHEQTSLEHLDVVLAYPASFRGRQLTIDDLTTEGMRVVLRKGSEAFRG